MGHKENQEKAELSIYEQSLKAARAKGGEARRNVARLSGDIRSFDRPDILITAEGGNRIVGIEHLCRISEIDTPAITAKDRQVHKDGCRKIYDKRRVQWIAPARNTLLPKGVRLGRRAMGALPRRHGVRHGFKATLFPGFHHPEAGFLRQYMVRGFRGSYSHRRTAAPYYHGSLPKGTLCENRRRQAV